MTAKTEVYGWTEVASGSSSYLIPEILDYARTFQPRDILDAGCGNGALAAKLLQAGYNVFGVDADEGGIAIAGKHSPSRFKTTLFSNDPAELGFTSDGKFDLVVSTEVVEHLYSPHELVSFAYKALRPGGKFVITTPYHGYVKNLALSVVNKWDDHHTTLWHGGHIKFWSKKTLATLLESAGFTIVDFRGVGRWPYLWKSMLLVAQRP